MIHNYRNRRGMPKTPNKGVRVIDQKIPVKAGGTAANDFLIIEINNTNTTQATARLFDASGLAALKDGLYNSNGVIITGKSTPYEAVLNNLASGEQFSIEYTKVRVDQGKELQFENPWIISESVPFSDSTNEVDKIYPSVYENSMQQQSNLLEITHQIRVTRKMIFSVLMEPETKIVLRFKINLSVQNG